MNYWKEEEVKQRREGVLVQLIFKDTQGAKHCFNHFMQIRLFVMESSLPQNLPQPPLTNKETKAQRGVDASVGHTASSSGVKCKSRWSALPGSLLPTSPLPSASCSHAQSSDKRWKGLQKPSLFFILVPADAVQLHIRSAGPGSSCAHTVHFHFIVR